MGPASLAVTAFCSLLLGPRLDGAWRPPELQVEARSSPAGSEELTDIALRYLGRPYDSGGVGSPGFDCSGFTCRVFAEGGYALPRVSRDQAKAGRKVPIDQLRPGDLLFFADRPGKTRVNHVGVYLGDGELVHASTGEGEVVVARLDTAWFRDHLVSARRVIGEPSPDVARPGRPGGSGIAGTGRGRGGAQTGSVAPALAPTVELVEHAGEDALSPLLRRPARVPRAPFGPELPGVARTAVAVRAAAITELGTWGLTVAPELSIYVKSIALEAAIALPIRFELDARPTVGSFSEARDFGRLVRTLALGLRGADVELRVSQFGDLGLLSGLVVDDLAPGSRATGVPGFSLGRAPLGFAGRVRADLGSVEAIIDDVFEPGLMGVGLSAPIGPWLRASAGASTDQRAAVSGGRRAVNALEAELAITALETRRWSLEASLAGAGLRSLGDTGGLLRLRAFAEHRFSGAASAHFAARVGWVGRHALDALFSATYPGREEAQLSVLGDVGSRAIAGAELGVKFGRFVLGAAYEDALGGAHLALDRRLEVLGELKGLSLSGTRVLDLRVAYGARGLGRGGSAGDPDASGAVTSAGYPGALNVLHAAAALRLSSGFRVELYVEHGAKPRAAGADPVACSTDASECADTRTEGGVGVALAFETLSAGVARGRAMHYTCDRMSARLFQGISGLLVLVFVGLACARELDAESFRREAEKAYVEVNPGWGIVRRDGGRTTYVRGDQLETFDVAGLFEAYKASKQSSSAFFEAWTQRATEEAKARRRSLEQAKTEVIPIVKSGSWVRVQDIGAIGPPHLQDRIRPWRRDVAADVFLLLGVPEDRVGYRFASVEEVRAAPEGEDAWVERAVSNLRARVGTSTASQLRDTEGRLLVHDLSGVKDVSGLILDPRFRAEMLEAFGREELGAAAPIRDVLIVFESGNVSAVKPVRARTHQLYDTQNHPGFRGLLRFDRAGISILEPGVSTPAPPSP